MGVEPDEVEVEEEVEVESCMEEEAGALTLNPCEKPLKEVFDGLNPGLFLVSSHAIWLAPASVTLTSTSFSVGIHRTELLKTL